MDWLLDFFKGAGVTFIIGIVTFLFTSIIKKGQFENWGIVVGKGLSKFGNSRLGKTVWEKLEDIILVALITFVHGLKKGADSDDKIFDKKDDKDKK